MHRFSRSLVAVIAVGVVWGLTSCSGESEASVSGCARDPYACDCEQIAVSVVGQKYCVGTPLCDIDADCADAVDPSYVPFCEDQGDTPIMGFSGRCAIPCSATCPVGMTCVADRCWFPAQ